MNNRSGKFFDRLLAALLLTLLIIVSGSGAAPAAGYGGKLLINIPEEVEVSGPEISLGEIASISGLNGEMYSRMRALNLGRAGLPGYSKGLSCQYISGMIEGLGFRPAEFELRMPPRVKVRTACRILKGEVLLAFARNYLERELDYPPERLKITPGTFPEDVVLPDCEYQLTISPSSEGGDLLDNPYLMFQISINEKVYRRVFIGFDIKLLDEVFVAARDIERGERLEQKDFRLELRVVNNLQGDPLRNFSLPLFKEGLTRMAIPAGEVLTDYYLGIPRQQVKEIREPQTEKRPETGQFKERPIQLVRYGEELEAEVMVGNVTVSTRVKACQNGARGEYITVENPVSGRRFKAQIIEANLVRVKQ